jgi:hypothetical protein
MSERADRRRESRVTENKVVPAPYADNDKRVVALQRQVDAMQKEVKRLTKDNKNRDNQLRRIEAGMGIVERTVARMQPLVDRISRIIK